MSGNKERKSVDYYFSALSSFAYLGHRAFCQMATKLDLSVAWRPMQLGKVFAGSGGLLISDRHPARNRVRMLELQRWRTHRGLEMNLTPKFFPTNPTLADCAIIMVQEEGRDPADLINAIMEKLWIKDADIAQEDVVASCLQACGEDAQAVLKAAKSGAAMAIYEANSEKALGLDVIGSPCVVYQGEPFWGQDRFFMLEEAIESGRQPYSA